LSLVWIVAPRSAAQRAIREGVSTLRMVRTMFTASSMLLLLVGVVVIVLAVVSDGENDVSGWLVAGGVTAWGAAALLLSRVMRRPAPCDSNTSLAAWYRTTFFLRVAFASSAALVGFLGFVLTWTPWIYVIGAVFAAVGMVRLAPTERRLQADQAAINGQGGDRSLLGRSRSRLRLDRPSAAWCKACRVKPMARCAAGTTYAATMHRPAAPLPVTASAQHARGTTLAVGNSVVVV